MSKLKCYILKVNSYGDFVRAKMSNRSKIARSPGGRRKTLPKSEIKFQEKVGPAQNFWSRRHHMQKRTQENIWFAGFEGSKNSEFRARKPRQVGPTIENFCKKNSK